MPAKNAARLLVALTLITTSCGPSSPPPETVVAVAAPTSLPPVVEVPEACPEGTHPAAPQGCIKDSAVAAQVAGPPDDRARDDRPALSAQVAAATAPPSGPPATTLEALRDPRVRKQPRGQALVSVEIRGLLSLLTSAPPTAADRPNLIRHLADDYAELEAGANRDGNDKVAASAQKEAIKYYSALVKEAPQFCLNSGVPSTTNGAGCTDEALYFLAYEYERGAQVNEARKTYLKLLQSWPTSRYVPAAYLAFGEIFFQESAADPSKWALAEQSYNEVIKYPPPGNDVYGYALLRLGAVYQSQKDPRKAHVAHEKLRKGAAAHPDWSLLTVPAGLLPAGAP